MKHSLLIGLVLMAASASAQAPSLLGDWESPKGSVVRVYGCGTAICMRLVKLEPGAQATDTSNPKPEMRARPLCGLEVGTELKPRGENEAGGGRLYDPDSGRTYTGSMRVEGGLLKLHGSWGPFGRTETWKRFAGSLKPCG